MSETRKPPFHDKKSRRDKADKGGRPLLVTFARTSVGIVVFVGVLILILAVGHQVSREVDYRTLVRTLRYTSGHSVLLAILATGISFVALIARDVGALRYAQLRVPWPAILLAGFCGNALGNAVGVGGLTGGAVRYRIYGGVGVRPDGVARMMIFIAGASCVGLVVSYAISTLFEGATIAMLFHRSAALVKSTSVLILASIGVAVFLFRGQTVTVRGVTLPFPNPASFLVQVALTGADLMAAAAALWVLLPVGAVGFTTLVPIFVGATGLGVLSHLPGGFGVFDTLILVALHRQLPTGDMAPALLLYRAIYFLLPLFISAALLAGLEVRRLAIGDTAEGTRRLANSSSRLAPNFLAVLTFAAGVMLVVSGATPAFGHRLALLALHLPLWLIETSSFLGSLVGMLLLFVARGLFHRLDGAWWLAVTLTLAGFVLSLTRGLAYVEASILAGLVLLLAVSHQQFPRRASLTAQTFTTSWFVAIGAVLAGSFWILRFAFQNVAFARHLWWQVEVDAQAPRALRAMLGVSMLAVVLGVVQLLRVGKGLAIRPERVDLARAEEIIRRQDRSDAILALMGDKSLLFSASGEAFLMFAKRGRSWISLLDPVGPRSEWAELIWGFAELATAHGGRAAFYQIRPDTLPLYIDAGLRIVKIGEEARIDLRRFSLQGARRSHLRYAIRRGEREGLTFELVPPGALQEIIPTLQAISDDWLARRGNREKGFSVAAYQADFVLTQSAAIVRQAGVAVAFATVMRTDQLKEATVGLMRHLDSASPFAMEFIFVQLLLAFQKADYAVLSLGVAPLSGLGEATSRSRWYWLGNFIWAHGKKLYDFQGLRLFKSKFNPVWEPRYLAVTGWLGPLFALADVAALTSAAKKER